MLLSQTKNIFAFPLYKAGKDCYNSLAEKKCTGGSMDRASDSGSEGWGFESLPVYQRRIIRTLSQYEKGSDYFCFWEDDMDRIISCEFNIDTACVEVKYADGSMISIDCTRVENEVARNMYEASELDWLVYNAPVDYVNLLLHGDIQEYLKNVTEYHPLDN